MSLIVAAARAGDTFAAARGKRRGRGVVSRAEHLELVQPPRRHDDWFPRGRRARRASRGRAPAPGSWRRVFELLEAPILATPTRTIAAPDDDVAERLAAVSNPHAGKDWPIHHLDRTEYSGEDEDPDHSARSVDEQLANGGKGFVENFARISQARAHREGKPVPEPDLVMGFYDAEDLPVYDHLAEHYCVVDRWFSSVPGATWPNRLYAATGRAAGTRDDVAPPLYSLPSFARHLDQSKVDWRWYSFDPATLRAIDPAYRFSNHHHFAFLDKRKITIGERAVGELIEEGPSFLDDVAEGHLPPVSWIDPRFKDLCGLPAGHP